MGSGKWKLFFDYKGFVLEHLRDMTPMAAKKIIEVGEMGVPARIQAIAFFNVPTFVEWFCTLFKKAAKAKLTERVCRSFTHLPQEIFWSVLKFFSSLFTIRSTILRITSLEKCCRKNTEVARRAFLFCTVKIVFKHPITDLKNDFFFYP